MLPRCGELRTADLVGVFGRDMRSMPYIDVLVLAADGGAPIAARVELGDSPFGRTTHRGLVCGGCRQMKHLLVARDGVLRCRACLRLRTNHQRDRTLADWRRRGGREGDRLLRLLVHPTRRITRAKIEEARELAAQIVAADRHRLERLRANLEALTICAETRCA